MTQEGAGLSIIMRAESTKVVVTDSKCDCWSCIPTFLLSVGKRHRYNENTLSHASNFRENNICAVYICNRSMSKHVSMHEYIISWHVLFPATIVARLGGPRPKNDSIFVMSPWVNKSRKRVNHKCIGPPVATPTLDCLTCVIKASSSTSPCRNCVCTECY